MEEEKKPENEVKNNDIEKIDVPLDEITSADITEASFDSELLLTALHSSVSICIAKENFSEPRITTSS